MKRIGVIYPLGWPDPSEPKYKPLDDEQRTDIDAVLEEQRVELARVFPGVRFMVTLSGAAPVAFEFDDEDEPLLDRILPLA